VTINTCDKILSLLEKSGSIKIIEVNIIRAEYPAFNKHFFFEDQCEAMMGWFCRKNSADGSMRFNINFTK
jgi:hypothetical protein